MFSIPLDKCMFSYPGSYLAIGRIDNERYAAETCALGEGVYIRQLYGFGNRQCLKVSVLQNNVAAEVALSATPSMFSMHADCGQLNLTYAGVHCIAGKANSCGVRLEMAPVTYEYAAVLDERHFLLNSAASKIQFLVTVLEGCGRLDAPYGEQSCQYITLDLLPDGQSERLLFLVEDFEKSVPVYKESIDFEACANAMSSGFSAFVDQFPVLEGDYRKTEIDALYTLWSCIVSPAGYLTRDAVMMSNNWMPNVWTWDSVINSMALRLGDHRLAKEQFFASLDHQTHEGRLPDYINPSEVLWNFTKPPIHGIAVLHGMLDTFDAEELVEAYEKMQLQVDYWLVHMDSDYDGIPQYNHGNDCGWDNCTPFRIGPPIEGPDLTAYIILQMYALKEMGERLGRNDREWEKEAQTLLERLLVHSYHADAFHVYQAGTHQEYIGGDSLYPFMPLVLGRYLPKEIFDCLVAALKEPNRFLTEVGLASESLRSPYYEEDSYWRGPVWPSVMLLLIQGIADGGDAEFSKELSRRFCKCICKSGFAENFQATTGRGLRDPAHTWTAAAYLVLSCQYM